MGVAGRAVPASGRSREEEDDKKSKKKRYESFQCSVCLFTSTHRGHFESNEKLFRRADNYLTYTNMVLTCKGDPPYSPRCRNEVLEANKALLAAKPTFQAQLRVKPGETMRNPREDKGMRR